MLGRWASRRAELWNIDTRGLALLCRLEAAVAAASVLRVEGGNRTGEIELGVLGPVVVRVDGAGIQVGGGRLRVLLACLLMRLNRVVAVDDLVDQLWGQGPPGDARRVLQTNVTRLRQALGEAGPRVVTRPPGYLFEAPESVLDLVRFRGHVERARAAGELEVEAAELRAGLALWRGEPLADVPSESLQQVEVPRLREERLWALERRVEVDLELGRHAEVVGELYGLTREYPLREGLWAQLMVALHRSGRRADALLAFQSAGVVLREELGLEPGERLRAVHQLVLAAEPATSTRQQVVVRQLPGDVGDFVGRDRLIRRIGELVGAGGPIVTLCGPPGIGKTALAVHVAHELAARYPDGQLFLDLRGYSAGEPLTAGDALARFLRALGIPPDQIPTEVDELSSLFRSTVAGRRILVVLDNAASPDHVRPLLPWDPGCPVIITSRDELRGLTAIDGARRVQVEVLTEDEALSLIGRIAGRRMVEAEPVAAQQLVAACGLLPLALRISAANLVGGLYRTIEAYVDDLFAGDRLSKLEIAGDDRSAVRAVFGLSYAALAAEPARLFRLLGLVPGPSFDSYAAANLADRELAEAGALLDTLAAANLIQLSGPGRYQFHDLIRAHAAALCAEHDRPADQKAAYEQLVGYYATTVDGVAEHLYSDTPRVPPPATLDGPGRSDMLTASDQLAWLDEEHANLAAVVRQSESGDAEHVVCAIVSGLYGYLNTQRHDRDWRSMFTTGLGIATRANDLRAMAIMHFGLAMLDCAHVDTRAGMANLERAIDLYAQAGDLRLRVQTMSVKSMLALSMGEFDTALPELETALAIQRKLGDRAGEAKTLGRIGLIHMENGPALEGVAVLSRALALCEELGLRVATVYIKIYLGWARLHSGDPTGAIREFEAAAELAVELHFPEQRADSHEGRTFAHIALGQPDEACRHAERAVELTGAISSYQYEISTMITLGAAQLNAGQVDEGTATLLRALNQSDKMEFQFPVLHGELLLASGHRQRGEHERATRILERVLASTYRPYRGQAFVELARIHLDQGDRAAAIEQATEGLEILRTCQYRGAEAQALQVLRQAHRTRVKP